MVISDGQLLDLFGRFLWPFIRISAFILVAPLYGSTMVPRLVKISFALVIAGFIGISNVQIPTFQVNFVAIEVEVIQQVLFGIILGMAVQIIIAGISCAGEICGIAMGLSFAQLQFGESTSDSPVLYDLMVWVGLMGFIAMDGPVWLISGFVHSFDQGIYPPNFSVFASLAGFGEAVFLEAIELSIPVIAAAIMVNVVVGIASVFSSSLNLMSVGFPVLILVCLAIFIVSIPMFGDIIDKAIRTGMEAMLLVESNG
jgi:flagellar biosynthetic protein FliR